MAAAVIYSCSNSIHTHTSLKSWHGHCWMTAICFRIERLSKLLRLHVNTENFDFVFVTLNSSIYASVVATAIYTKDRKECCSAGNQTIISNTDIDHWHSNPSIVDEANDQNHCRQYPVLELPRSILMSKRDMIEQVFHWSSEMGTSYWRWTLSLQFLSLRIWRSVAYRKRWSLIRMSSDDD